MYFLGQAIKAFSLKFKSNLHNVTENYLVYYAHARLLTVKYRFDHLYLLFCAMSHSFIGTINYLEMYGVSLNDIFIIV